MDAFATLEKKVEQLIGAYRSAQARVAELEQENRALRESPATAASDLHQSIAALEAERSALRTRLERLLGLLDAVEL